MQREVYVWQPACDRGLEDHPLAFSKHVSKLLVFEEPESKRTRQILLVVCTVPMDLQMAIEHGVTVRLVFISV